MSFSFFLLCTPLPLCLVGGNCQTAERNLRPSHPFPVSRGKSPKRLSLRVKRHVGERKNRREERGLNKWEENCVGDSDEKKGQNKNTHAHTHLLANSHTHRDYPGLILPSKDRQIGSELIKRLPLTGAKQ